MNCDPELHKTHMCDLKLQGNTELIKTLSSRVTEECEECGARANDPQYVCSPRQLPGLDWLGDGADNCNSKF
jgi:hypothetical protein